MTAPVISFINMKGGVGKTTLCIGIAEYLSNYLGKKILLIDIDPQFNATQSIMGKYNRVEEYINTLQPNNKTIRKILETKNSISTTKEIINIDDVITEITNNLDIILGNMDIIFDTDQVSIRVKKLNKFIIDNDLKSKYDYILIDSPPTISIFTDAALIASDYYVAPIKIDYYSILGASNLINVIDYLKENHNPSIQHLGFVYSNTENRLTDKTQKIKRDFEQNPKFTDKYFFNSKLSYLRDLMVGGGGNIASAYTKSRQDIHNICQELMNRVSALEEARNGE
ncbi:MULTISPECIES: ParA family protein [Proteus]|uniref:AAA family ATPase n=1 Tax=Proteus vulgaris TaxID=585 RepID=A0A6G6SFT5_PROVU|nr:AAA family ATPase [Proteus vulgaris]QIF93574.1 AAA family ATPase [Proteus vulgaris]